MWASCIACGGPVWGAPSVRGPRTAGHTSHHVPAGRTCQGLCLLQGAQAGPGHDGRGQHQARLPCLVALCILFSTGSFLRRSNHRGHPFGQLVCGCVAWPAVHPSIADLLKGRRQLQQLTGCWWVGEGPALQVSAVGLLGAAEGSRRPGPLGRGQGGPPQTPDCSREQGRPRSLGLRRAQRTPALSWGFSEGMQSPEPTKGVSLLWPDPLRAEELGQCYSVSS